MESSEDASKHGHRSIAFRSVKLPFDLQEEAQRSHSSTAFRSAKLPFALQDECQRNSRIAFRSVKLPSLPSHDCVYLLRNPSSPSPAIHVPSFCFNSRSGASAKPLLDIEDVRAFLRSRFGAHTPQSDHRSTRTVHTGVFGIGTMGFSGSDGGYVDLLSPQANEHLGQISSHPFTQQAYSYEPHDHLRKDGDALSGDDYPHFGSRHQPCSPLLDMEDVRYAIDKFLHVTWLRRHSTTSLANRLPWHEPRAPFLARGLEWPPDYFESEEERKEYYRKARKRKPYLLGSPPLWTVSAFNVGFLLVIMYNPFGKFYDFLMNLPS